MWASSLVEGLLGAVRHAAKRLAGRVEVGTLPGMGTTFRLTIPMKTLVSSSPMVEQGHRRSIRLEGRVPV